MGVVIKINRANALPSSSNRLSPCTLIPVFVAWLSNLQQHFLCHTWPKDQRNHANYKSDKVWVGFNPPTQCDLTHSHTLKQVAVGYYKESWGKQDLLWVWHKIVIYLVRAWEVSDLKVRALDL